MLVLSADTSLAILSVALVNDGALIGALALEGRGSRNEKLLPAIDWLLSENAIDRRTLDLLAVTRGPGSFTGVRIGLATMQGLALAIRRPICAMSTHEAVAFGESGRIAVVDDAGRGETYVTLVDDGQETRPPHLGSVPEDRRVILLADVMQRDNVALRCARRAIDIEQRGEGDRYRDVTPIYVRLAEAEVKLQQKQNA
ncbi:MAG TPA: tRNA (adenosine(37)-N6)-threonylcarbamoyltransferase complex dimerization subunit type 1 TsaB [Thermoanaerobaculia bacterium]|jgi:tRNA threonylcarbamoyl adenosine modification protein YeaZ|nr:tRNA (adenosine(37)-N6)-threonylcarbamoyltransferase complex dimerization subunit type 1 TsaB [Thermoanaerobaculia bacterium]